MIKAKILIIDDDQDILLAASMVFKKHFSDIKTLDNPSKLMNLISRENFDVILLDMNYSHDTSSGHEGFFWLRNILSYNPEALVVLMTAYGDVEKAVKAIKNGAFDFVLKPWENAKLVATIQNGLARKEAISKKSEGVNHIPETFIGSSVAMKRVIDTIKKVAQTDAHVLITGENGTGKQLVARELHRLSDRNRAPFVNVDLGSLSETIFESELFGHIKGAFTDAKEDRIGRFEEANNGTIFLDEIGNLSLSQQAKLLTVVQSKTVAKLGSNKNTQLNIRIIAATNSDLHKMVNEHCFRQDLLFRMNTVEINIPPLRERSEDIEELFFHYLSIYEKKYKKSFAEISKKDLQGIKKLKWLGNVRELQHKVERAVILSDEHDFDFSFFIEDEKETESIPHTMNIDEIEKSLVFKAIKKNGGNISKAASELGLTRAALYRRMEKYGY